ncbi:MAG: putative selenium-dependent hydroxylase accessory protein YqeC [Anaerolineae bacterium]|nr:putative selenium-dependent hydroxylase accessory protein YqeC [Anaerolineae bacterium]
MNLPEAFGFGDAPELAAIVGGGGKTSLMFALARVLGVGVVTSTTTRIFQAQIRQSPVVTFVDDLSPLEEQLKQHGRTLVVGRVEGEKAFGLSPEQIVALWQRPFVHHVLVEADGSRMRPVKAPADHEPVIPAASTLVIPVVGIDALEYPISAVAHRPERVSELTGLSPDDRLTPEAIAHLLTHPASGLKNVPESARVIPLINKVESATELAAAQQIARQVLAKSQGRIQRVVIAAVQKEPPIREVQTPVTAVILAAGEGRRMGQPKQLLPWGTRTVLGETLYQISQSLVHEIIVVTGHAAEAIGAEVGHFHGWPTPRLIHNPDYQKGEMLSSLQRAVWGLDVGVTAVLVILADQPMVESPIYDQLLAAFWQGKGELIVPTFNGQRGNPVLIGRRYFAELLRLPAESAPRALLQAHPDALYLLPVDTDSVICDLDTPEEYERLRPT